MYNLVFKSLWTSVLYCIFSFNIKICENKTKCENKLTMGVPRASNGGVTAWLGKSTTGFWAQWVYFYLLKIKSEVYFILK